MTSHVLTGDDIAYLERLWGVLQACRMTDDEVNEPQARSDFNFAIGEAFEAIVNTIAAGTELRDAAGAAVKRLYDSTSGAVCTPGHFPNHGHAVPGKWDDTSLGDCKDCAAWVRLEKALGFWRTHAR